MRVAIICAISLAIIVTVTEGEPGRRREMVKGGRRGFRSSERRKMGGGGEKTSRGDPGRRRKQMRRGRKLERQQQGRQSIVVKGNDCEFIYLADITSNSGCSNGQKFVLKGANNTRRQFLIVNDKAIIAFITKRKKFTACESFTDITTSVSCKTVSGLDNVTLPSSSSNSSSNSTGTATTAAASNTTAAASNATTAAPAASNTTAAVANATTAAAASNTTAASNSSGTCKCGIKKTTRIVGGSETEVNEYPWIAAFDFNGVDGTSPGGCAASLVANNWAVTASHCFYNTDGVLTVTKDSMSLVLGVHDRTGTTDTNRKVLTIEEIVLHPSYKHDTSANDIALLKLSESVDLDSWSPACLPTSGADFTGQNGWVYGWGVTAEGGASLAEKLLELEVPIVSDSVCASAMSPNGITITSDMLCAGGEEGKDACGGDSGGPFTVADSQSGAHTLVGAVSFGVGCARAGLYGVYADVPFFRTWIDETIAAKGGATFCS